MRVTVDERGASVVSQGSARRGLRALYRRLTGVPELERARREGYAEGRGGYFEFALGRAALLDARALAVSFEGRGAALLLLRASVRLFAQAHEKRAGAGTAAIFEQLSAEQRRSIEAVLDAQTGESELSRLGEAESRELLQLLERLALKLGEPLELDAERVRRVEASHWMRRSLLAIVLVVAAAWLGFSLFGRKNLARDKVVVTSSSDPRVAVAAPRALVDGDRKNLGFHTLKLPGQFATIDLGSVETIRAIEVFNRFDCCQDRAIPLRIDVSADGASWTTLARKTVTFTVWSVYVPPTLARFVRLTGESNNILHLAEVEVY
jgi:F5/8 type C domain-containing protein